MHTVSCILRLLRPCDSQEQPCSPTLPKNIQGSPCSIKPARATSIQWMERTEQSCFPLTLYQGTFPYDNKLPALCLCAGIHDCQGCKSTNWPFLCLQALSSTPTPGQDNSGKIIHPLQFQKPLQLAKLPSAASKGNPAGTVSHCSAHAANFPYLAGKSGSGSSP